MAAVLDLPTQPLPIGRNTRIAVAAGATVEWINPPQPDRAEINEYPDHLLVNPIAAGPITIGYKDVDGKTWVALKAGPAPRAWTLPDLSWMKKLVPSSGVGLMIALAVIAWLLFTEHKPSPGPGPGPLPPNPPGPVDPPAPIAESGFRVLMVYEKDDLGKIPAKQAVIFTAKDTLDYLDSRCIGGKAGWRIWDKNQDTKGDTKLWQDAFARPHPQLPWILISNGKTGFEGPLPATVAETVTLMRKYGGN